jgi:hypothetical protein
MRRATSEKVFTSFETGEALRDVGGEKEARGELLTQTHFRRINIKPTI